MKKIMILSATVLLACAGANAEFSFLEKQGMEYLQKNHSNIATIIDDNIGDMPVDLKKEVKHLLAHVKEDKILEQLQDLLYTFPPANESLEQGMLMKADTNQKMRQRAQTNRENLEQDMLLKADINRKARQIVQADEEDLEQDMLLKADINRKARQIVQADEERLEAINMQKELEQQKEREQQKELERRTLIISGLSLQDYSKGCDIYASEYLAKKDSAYKNMSAMNIKQTLHTQVVNYSKSNNAAHRLLALEMTKAYITLGQLSRECKKALSVSSKAHSKKLLELRCVIGIIDMHRRLAAKNSMRQVEQHMTKLYSEAKLSTTPPIPSVVFKSN
ncbi:MAG: hypothetical protein LBT70_00915 [Holosporaceae bacterium]|nr:hypothetical protein [Holosporaceae bacterium]